MQALAVDAALGRRLASWGSDVSDVAVVDVPTRSAGAPSLVARLAARVPVVAVSLSSAAREPALAAGATAFAEKDGDANGLVTAILAAAGRRPGDNVRS